MKSLQRLVLSAFPLFLFSQNPVNPVPKERIDRYVEFASRGEEYTFQVNLRGEKISQTRKTLVNYHGDQIGILYTSNMKGDTHSLSTVLTKPSGSLVISENVKIDGIPEKVLFIGSHIQNFDPKDKKLVRQYHQIINYVLDSLPKRE